LARGERLAKLEDAKRMKDENIDVSLIITGLRQEEIEKL